MTTYTVFHITRPLVPTDVFYNAVEDGKVEEAIAADMYEAVAVVVANTLTDVFRDTNHIDWDWTENENVDAVVDRPRSTSVGDIVVEHFTGKVFVCAPYGWNEMEASLLTDKLDEEADRVIDQVEIPF